MSDHKIRQQSVDGSGIEGQTTLDRLREEIDVAIPIASPRMYVARYVDELGGEARTATLAREVAAEADEAGLTANGPHRRQSLRGVSTRRSSPRSGRPNTPNPRSVRLLV